MSTKYSSFELAGAVLSVCEPFTKQDLPWQISVWRGLYDKWASFFRREMFVSRLDLGYDALCDTYDIDSSDAHLISIFLDEEEFLVCKMNRAAICIQRFFRACHR